MARSNFYCLEEEFPILSNIGRAAEYQLHADPVTSLFKLRQFGEVLSELLFELHHLELPSDDSFHNRLKTLEFESILPANIKDLLFTIKSKGNIAVHQRKGTSEDAKGTMLSAFKVAKWFYLTYAAAPDDISEVRFHVPENLDARHALHVLAQDYKALEEKLNQLMQERDTTSLPKETQEAIKQRSQSAASKVEMSEEETRDLIDAQLKQAGWEADTRRLNYKRNKTLPERGKKIAIAEWPAGPKWIDYALFIGTDLYAIVESKKYAADISTNLDQSKVYAELAEAVNEASLLGRWESYKVPFLFSTNGRPYLEQIKTKSGIWFLDVRDKYNNSRPLQGWYSPDGLQKLFERNIKAAQQKLENESSDFLQSDAGLGLRQYQIKAIEAVENTLANHPDRRRALIAMATGTGKTRTIIGLCYRLIKANRFRRILFLVDRTLLGTQAINAFKDNKIAGLNTFSEIYDMRDLKDIVPDVDTRLHFATVQGMVKRLFFSESDEGMPSVDQYDCIIIDEAHRGYLLDKEMDEEELNFKNQSDYVSKYRMVLDYFDAYAIGLTATPALHTKEIFGSPVYTYSYREAVIDGFLIDHDPPHIIKTKLSEEGIKWEKGEKPKAIDVESNAIVELEELEDELKIEIAGFNSMVITESFNRTVIRELIKHLDPDGDEKTLIFAATDQHADAVVQYLKEEFAAIGIDVPDNTIQKITGKSYDPQELVTRFKNEKYPNIAVTVDLLTTGIDVPSICHLVFLRRIRSRILYEQMLGRATRRCDEIGKEAFQVYDAVRIYETLQDYTQMKPVAANPKATFKQLVDELTEIESEKGTKQQVEQIIARLQRKKRFLADEEEQRFRYNAGGDSPNEFIGKIRNMSTAQAADELRRFSGLWKYLDELKPNPSAMLVSDHEDEYRGTERGYGKAKKPEDYLENFADFILANQNKIAALNVVCTRPAELDRKSLRDLMIALDQEGYNARSLHAAWRDAKNEDIAADIISFIRTMALGSSLVSHEERIRRAVDDIRSSKPWNVVQKKWIDRIEKQLLQETVLRLEDLNDSPFDDAGGFDRLNKIFEQQLPALITRLNNNLYSDIA